MRSFALFFVLLFVTGCVSSPKSNYSVSTYEGSFNSYIDEIMKEDKFMRDYNTLGKGQYVMDIYGSRVFKLIWKGDEVHEVLNEQVHHFCKIKGMEVGEIELPIKKGMDYEAVSGDGCISENGVIVAAISNTLGINRSTGDLLGGKSDDVEFYMYSQSPTYGEILRIVESKKKQRNAQYEEKLQLKQIKAKDLELIWKAATHGQRGIGDSVCILPNRFDNRYEDITVGYVEQLSDDKYKVLLVAKIKMHLFEGNQLKNGHFNYQKMEETRWIGKAKIANCEFGFE